VSRNLYFFTPIKDIALPQPEITANIESAGKGYRVTLHSAQLARDVYLSFGDEEAKFSDNYIDLLAGETTQIDVTSKASLDQLRQAMKIVSLYDAFLPAQKGVAVRSTP
jgi:beta-mannosidase